METHIVYNILTAKGTGKYIYGSSRSRRETILDSNFFFLAQPMSLRKIYLTDRIDIIANIAGRRAIPQI